MFDFGIGSSELLVIAALALIVIGPKELPKVLRTIGQLVTKMRAMAREFQSHLEDAARESGLDEVKKDVSEMTNFATTEAEMKKHEAEMRAAFETPDAGSASSKADVKTAAKTEAGTADTKSADKKPAKAKPAKATKAAKAKPAKAAKAKPVKAKKNVTTAKTASIDESNGQDL